MKPNSRFLVLSLALLAGSFAAPGMAAPSVPQIYHCEYHVSQPEGKSFTMAGNIVLSDVDATSQSATYLTLEPPKVSGIDVTARILITHWTDGGGYYYNPMTLHPRGDTAAPVASALLSGARQQLIYQDPQTKASYTLLCQLL